MNGDNRILTEEQLVAWRDLSDAWRTNAVRAVLRAQAVAGSVPFLANTVAPFSRVVFTEVGRMAGADGEPRDWTMPDDWHRGYLRGRLARLKEMTTRTVTTP
jgi:hypothetical protein